ncbi:DNA adenine methylase [Candidatus Mycobacterium wuenschmannii]|uniref:site-specific DNA-methyltransferase (adenine-specific) n=1 Tax=Candidatus Mycobacterium wuenschmannii TaxID=3027808 RepID=A0ABY8W0D8_9MYCO|nr:DNA adenine methylase [Candidatus Mycobacterium wuenschmannii]WIM87893.1 DNA adenine methylase [Candidatus Mycobacterium wuenschmannii]
MENVASSAAVVAKARTFPRIRYMGSKYRLLPHLERVFADINGATAVDAFSGSGVVSYLLKAQGYQVTANDFLTFPTVIARATVANSTVQLEPDLIDEICGPPADDRDFIQSTFDGLYFTPEDRKFLDTAWSHIDRLTGYRRDLAIAALILSGARKQPRGVFTFTDSTRYADGRRDLRISLREHFRERAADYNATVFSNKLRNTVRCGEVFDIPCVTPDLVYLDPPYAPPSDDNDYIKRYHFLEGLSVYWRGVTIMDHTKTKKLEKRFTPFAYKHTIEDALARTFEHFQGAGAIVLSYSSNAIPDATRILDLLGKVKPCVETIAIDHKYSFGTHAAAARRDVSEYLFIGRDE